MKPVALRRTPTQDGSAIRAAVLAETARRRPVARGRMLRSGMFNARTRDLLIGSRDYDTWIREEHAWWARRRARDGSPAPTAATTRTTTPKRTSAQQPRGARRAA